ncbi:hypothetical protein OPQ81_005040 [Rhizoctonia solani]|nr:hypothetical protein OPQ81_005040 [Rhizoctonia solani]
MTAPEMDLAEALAGAMPPIAGADIEGKTPKADVESRWTSTSSIESELDHFWHDSTPSINHFYTTQDTVNTLDSFDFNDDNLFLGPFDSCSTGTSQHQTQDSARHMTEASAAGVESFDFASTQLNSMVPELQQPIVPMNNALDVSTWSIPTTADSDYSALKDRLSNAMVRGDGGQLFIPEDSLRTILSHLNVTTELRKHFPHTPAHGLRQLATQVTVKDLRKDSHLQVGLLRTFAILVLMDIPHKIIDFASEGLADNDRPLVRVKVASAPAAGEPLFQLRRKDALSTQLRSFNGWTQAEIDTYERLQWRVCSPVFWEISEQQEGAFLDLEEATVLPYIESWQNKKHDHYKGGNSEVWKVKIHEAHHKFQNLNALVPNNPYFAIKRLKSKDDEAFRREVRNLLRLHNAEHPNLLSLLATYKYKGYYHLAGKDEMRWLASQCASIASALKSVHAGAESWMQNMGDGPSDKQRMAMNKFGLHGDIKPENIFIFNKGQQKKALAMGLPYMSENNIRGGSSSSTSSSLSSSPDRDIRSCSPSSVADECVMSIGDFGGGEFFGPVLQPRSTQADYGRLQAARARHEAEARVAFLGCLGGLTEFARRRTTRTAAGKLSDEYFETFIDASQTGGIGATLKESVLAWINDLYRHKNASQFIRDFLDYITNRMFIVENAFLTRASGAEVAEHLHQLTRKCLESDAYCLPSPVVSTPWDVFAVSPTSSSSDLAVLSGSGSLDDFAESAFSNTVVTEDVAATTAATAAMPSAWHFSTMNDVSPLAQWNTAPIMPVGGPLVWNNNTNNNHSASPMTGGAMERKRKRVVEDVTDEHDRRVSPKTTTTSPSEPSPQTTPSGSSSTVESPTVEAGGNNSKPSEKRFACPYYKNNPGKFRQKRTCCGPGWPTEEALRVKKRVPPNTTEEQRWIEVYMVLFPDAGLDSLPTPFYENDPTDAHNTGETSLLAKHNESPNGDAWFCSPSDYEQYLLRSLPQRVQRELERQIQKDFGFFGNETQTKRVVDMVQKLQLRLFQQFQQQGEGRHTGLGSDGGG